jgi:uncharacterized membrane protein YgcG
MSAGPDTPGGSPLSLSLRIAALLGAIALVAALLLSCLATSALAKDGQVTVRAAGTTNASVTIRLSDLGNNDINNRSYRLKAGVATISGHSLLQVMNAADAESDEINLATIPAIEIDRPNGSPIRISGNDMRNPSAFTDGPPVFYEDNGATVFVMPGAGAATGNRFRFVFAPVGISVSSGASYEVELTASRTKVKVGQKVSFSVRVSGQQSGDSLSFRWRFGDGAVRTTSSGRISHSFSRAGDFSVIVDVTGSSGAGQSGILIEVGGTDSNKPKPKPKNPEGQESQDSGGDGGTGGFGGGSGGFGSGTGSGSGSFGAGAGGGPSSATPPAGERQDRDPDPSATPEDGLVEVAGQLVDPETGTVVTPADAQAVESADPAPSGTEQGGFGIPGAAWTLAGVGLLMGLGAFAELRVFSRIY